MAKESTTKKKRTTRLTIQRSGHPLLISMIRSLSKVTQRKEASRQILLFMLQAVGGVGGQIYLLTEDQKFYGETSVAGTTDRSLRGKKFYKTEPLVRLISGAKGLILRGAKGNDPALASWMMETQIEICLPLYGHSRLIGFCLLGGKKGAGPYTVHQVHLLQEMAEQAALLMDNIFLWESLRKARSLIQRTNRFRSLEVIGGGFAHEIRNPLTSIKTFISLVPQMKDDDEFIHRFSRVASEDVDRIERLLDDILQFTKAPELRLSDENLNDIISSSVYFIRMEAENRKIQVRVELGENLPVVVLDRQQIKQVLLNLFLNAMDAMDRGGTLHIQTGSASLEGADCVEIQTTDTGCGIPPENLPFIFDPFFTTKHEEDGEREGTGLGLAIVQQIIEDHRGHIEVKSRLGHGTTFAILLPCSPKVGDIPLPEKVASK